MTIAPPPLLLLGIDAASAPLLEGWAADGTMPHLGALVERGTVGHTRGIEGFFVGSTWPSMYTGTSPARHGVHYLLQLRPGTYELHWCAREAFVRREPFWSVLGRAGKRVAVLDVPLTRLDPAIDGVQVVEWGGHDSLYGFRATPPALAAEIAARHGKHPVGASCDRVGRTAEDFRDFAEALEEGARRKGAWTRELLERGGWDLLVQVFTEAHCAGHQCWHLHDSSHPAHDARVAATAGDPLRRACRAIDAAIGEVLEVAGDARVVVFAAHGMSHRYGAQFLLDELLVRLGVTVPAVPTPARESALHRAATAAWRRLPESARRSLRPLARRVPGRGRRGAAVDARPPAIRADTARSRCFPINNGLAVGGIRLNLAGREPTGVLRPGAEAREFSDRLAADLLEIVDERTGGPLVRRVLRTAELYEGEHLEVLPDLLVEWSDDVPIGSTALAGGVASTVRARSARIGTVEGTNHYGRTGEHRPGGWFVAAGPGIPRGRLDREVSLLDLAPTFTRMLGVEMPGVDGHAIPELAGPPA